MKKILAFISLAFLGLSGIVIANPSQFQGVTSDNWGSTISSPKYVTAGNATSTVTIISPIGKQNKYDKAWVHFRVTSTTTPPTLAFRVEGSDNGTDWFSYDNATSTGALEPTIYSYVFASTTWSTYNISSDKTQANHSFTIDTPAPYTRVVSYSVIGNPAYTLYLEAYPIREQI